MTAAAARSRSDRGSVFVESLIAAAIVAMALGATLQVIADSAGRDRAMDLRRAALQVAESEQARVGFDIALAPGARTGTDGDLAWRVDVTPYVDGVSESDAGDLWRVAVSVRPRDGGRVLARLETLRLGPAA